MKIITLSFLIFSLNVFSQQSPNTKKVDYKSIEKEIKNKDSEFYFQNLKKRFVELDTTLTTTHLHHLYYGSSLMNDFKVHNRHTLDEKILKYYQSENISDEQWNEIITYNENLIAKELFIDFEAFDILLTAYHITNNLDKYNKLGALYDKLLGTLLETGNGLTQETAMDVISTTHEYYIMQTLDLNVSGQSLLTDNEGRSYDFLAVKYTDDDKEKTENDDRLEGLYFDVTRLFELYAERFK